MTAHAISLVEIEVRLRTARRRVRVQLGIDAAVWAVAAGMLAAAVLVTVQRLLPQASIWSGNLQPYLVAMIGGAAATVVVAVAAAPIVLWRTPSMMGIARRADTVFHLQERVATALELTGVPGGDIVRAALTRDAAASAASIDPRALAPLALPRTSWLLPALGLGLAIAFAIPAAPSVRPVPTHATEDAVPAMTSEERQDVAGEIAKVADLIEVAAASRPDQTMDAIARTLDRLSQQVLADAELDRSGIAAQLDMLADFARSESLQWDAEVGAEVSDLISAAALEFDPSIKSSGSDTGNGEGATTSDTPSSRQPGEGELGKTRAGAEQTRRQGYEAGQTSTLVDKMKQFGVKNTGEDAGPSGEGTPTQADSDYFSMVERQAQGQTQRADMAGAFPPGQTGKFTDPMTNPWGGEVSQSTQQDEMTTAQGDLPAEFDPNAELMLEASATVEGERVRKDIPPVARFTAVDDRASSAGNPAWVTSPESEVVRDWLTPSQSKVVSAYFMALIAEAAK